MKIYTGEREKKSNNVNSYLADKVAPISQSTERSHTIDFVKGLLIIFVVIGHAIPGTLKESLVRWLIYSFHMPLFMGVSGFLVNGDKLNKLTWKEFATKYLHRIIIPWILAVSFFYIVTSVGSYSVISLVKAFIKPYYHLWFGIAYCVYLLITKVLQEFTIGGGIAH